MRVLRRLARLFDRARRSILRDGHLWASIAAIVHVHRRKKRAVLRHKSKHFRERGVLSTAHRAHAGAAAAAGRAPARPDVVQQLVQRHRADQRKARGRPGGRTARTRRRRASRRCSRRRRQRPGALQSQPPPHLVGRPRRPSPCGRSGRRLARGRPPFVGTRDGVRARERGGRSACRRASSGRCATPRDPPATARASPRMFSALKTATWWRG